MVYSVSSVSVCMYVCVYACLSVQSVIQAMLHEFTHEWTTRAQWLFIAPFTLQQHVRGGGGLYPQCTALHSSMAPMWCGSQTKRKPLGFRRCGDWKWHLRNKQASHIMLQLLLVDTDSSAVWTLWLLVTLHPAAGGVCRFVFSGSHIHLFLYISVF